MISTLQHWIRSTTGAWRASSYQVLVHERTRLSALTAIALLKLFNFFGGNWDIQWHVAIGRDSLFIPPHLMVMLAFVSGSAITLGVIANETRLARGGVRLEGAARLGVLRAPLPFFGILAGYALALLSALLDEAWHRIFGIDATLWSPPHLSIMLATAIVDISLLLGFAASARRLGLGFHWRSPLLWGLALAGAFAFEAVNFQISEAFIQGYRAGGVGLMGILFPLLVGILFPFQLMLAIRLAGRFWIAALLFGLAILFQYAGTGISAAGLAILKPVSLVDEFVRLNPESTLAKVREFGEMTGLTGLVGFQQVWMMWLSAIPIALVSLLDLLPWARRHPLAAAPLFSASLVLVSYLWFQQMPGLRDYPTTWGVVIAGTLISAAGGTLLGALGWRLGRLPAPASGSD